MYSWETCQNPVESVAVTVLLCTAVTAALVYLTMIGIVAIRRIVNGKETTQRILDGLREPIWSYTEKREVVDTGSANETPKPIGRCGNCLYYQASDNTCRLYPPQPIRIEDLVVSSRFPNPPGGADAWCGQWEQDQEKV